VGGGEGGEAFLGGRGGEGVEAESERLFLCRKWLAGSNIRYQQELGKRDSV